MEDVGAHGGAPAAEIIVDGRARSVDDLGANLLDVLRAHQITSVKDGCAPQGQCGCCTVLVDGQPRVACVTPIRRVLGKTITTAAGLDDAESWAQAFWDTGASQCGFCTPGIIVRLAGLWAKKPEATRDDVDRALAAHLCRCTGWNTIVEAWETRVALGAARSGENRDEAAASRRASIEGASPQKIAPELCLGAPVFSADSAPADALVALVGTDGEWVVGPDVVAARQLVDKVQGRRSTLEPIHPVPVPEGDWVATLQTTWTDPAYLETDASWCAPGADPFPAIANGGAFGAKTTSAIGAVARRLADEHQQPVLALASREHTVQFGPKRPPVGGGVRADGTGVLRVGGDEAVADAVRARVAAFAPTSGLVVEPYRVDGPPTSASLRGAGIAEAFALVCGADSDADPYSPLRVALPDGGVAAVSSGGVAAVSSGGVAAVSSGGVAAVSSGGVAAVRFDRDGSVEVHVDAGDPLDETILRSYVIGAVHMAISLVRSESLAVGADGAVHDLTVRSFGVLRASDTPRVEVRIEPSKAEPVPVCEAVFVATVAAAWRVAQTPPSWPVGVGTNRP